MTQTGFGQKLSDKLIKEAKDGDINAFESVYRTYADASYSLAYRICRDSMMAQDIVQNSFITVMKAISNFRGDGSFAGWIRRIVANETINKIRQQKRLQLVSDEQVPEIESHDLFNSNWLDSCRDLDLILSNLKDDARAVILLHEVEGYNHREIAEMFGKSESFSKVTLSRAYKQLKQVVKQQETTNAFNR